ncbi:hypothetical protein BASA81_008858 [Batrachochytrium salamandrivorans]|nr:hypothetical protein BASA81_008858 [Batrachochytrium salamandrivorans]
MSLACWELANTCALFSLPLRIFIPSPSFWNAAAISSGVSCFLGGGGEDRKRRNICGAHAQTYRMEIALAELNEKIALLDGDKAEEELQWVINSTPLQREKFLQGHKLKSDRAFELMVKCSKWRHSYGADGLIQKYLEPTQHVRFAKAYLPVGRIGEDYERRPVMLQRLAAVDFPRIISDLGLDKTVEYSIYIQEQLLEECTRAGLPHPGECIVVIDMGIEDMTNPPFATLLEVRAWIQGLLKFLQPFAALVDPYYPEMFHKIFFTRTPPMFASVWALAKHFVADHTREKIEILNGSKITPKLLEIMPLEVIPSFLGGGNPLIGMGKGGRLPKQAVENVQFTETLEQALDHIPEVSVPVKKSGWFS